MILYSYFRFNDKTVEHLAGKKSNWNFLLTQKRLFAYEQNKLILINKNAKKYNVVSWEYNLYSQLNWFFINLNLFYKQKKITRG